MAGYLQRNCTMKAVIAPTLLLVLAVVSGCSDPASSDPVTSSGGMCGTVKMQGSNPPGDQVALQAENCFFAAYQACSPASLIVSMSGVDVTSTTTFSTRSGSPCAIDGSTETVFVPSRRQTTTFSCAQLVRRNGGLLFQACGPIGEIFVPAPTP